MGPASRLSGSEGLFPPWAPVTFSKGPPPAPPPPPPFLSGEIALAARPCSKGAACRVSSSTKSGVALSHQADGEGNLGGKGWSS